MEFREKLIGLKKNYSILALGGGHLTLEHNGSNTTLKLLAVLLGHKGGTACGLLESGWVIPPVPGTKALIYMH